MTEQQDQTENLATNRLKYQECKQVQSAIAMEQEKERRAAVIANMHRLKALRLARDAELKENEKK
jgi:hypothetical protein